MEVKAVLKLTNPVEQVSPKFKKREFVCTVDHDSKYPQDILFQLIQDNCSKLDHITIGDQITVHFNLKGRVYNNKYYNQLEAWKITGETF